MYRNDGMVWAMLVPGPLDAAQDRLDEYFRSAGSWESGAARPYTLSAGTEPWCVVYSYDRDQVHTETVLAARLSAGLTAPVFSMSFADEDVVIPGVYEYRDGDEVGFVEQDYDQFLASYGCVLPPDSPLEPFEPPPAPCVVVFEGGNLSRIQEYVERYAPSRAPIVLERTGSSLPMLRWPPGVGSPWIGMATDLDDPGLTIFWITNYLEKGGLKACWASSSHYKVLAPDKADRGDDEYAASIKGASTPEGVIDALGIPREALGLS